MGGVNINCLSADAHARLFTSVIESNACHNLISLPTRIALETASSLDAWITNLNTADMISGILTDDVSDHLPIFALTSIREAASCKDIGTHMHRQINAESLQIFPLLISAVNWLCIYSEIDFNLEYCIFLDQVNKCYDSAFTVKTSRGRKSALRKPWLNDSLLKHIKKEKNV